MKYILINNQEDLEHHVKEINKVKYMAIDTEFIRTKTYYPKLCLLQIAYKAEFGIIIDPLSNIDISKVIDSIFDENIIKVFHGARQDLEIFYHLKGDVPKNIFDTQIAVMALNYPKDLSYEKTVKLLLDVQLDKTQKTSFWDKRPLQQSQLVYAAYDVIYLYEIYNKISYQLKSLKREHWLEENFKYLENSTLYESNVNKQLEKIINPKLSAKTVETIKNLLKWREDLAKKKDLSRNLVIHIDNIKSLASNNLESIEDLHSLLPTDIFLEYKEEIFQIIKKEQTQQEEAIEAPMPTLVKEIELTVKQKEMLFFCQLILKHVCLENNVNQAILASSEDLLDFVLNKEKSNSLILKGWRYEIFGRLLVDFFDGKLSLKLEKDSITLS